MINGAHSIIYSKDPEADREFLSKVLGLPSVDVGEGWLIFGLPPAEVAVHPADENDVHELYLMCEDVQTLVEALKERRVVRSGAEPWLGFAHSREPARRGEARDLRATPLAAEGDEGGQDQAEARPPAQEEHPTPDEEQAEATLIAAGEPQVARTAMTWATDRSRASVVSPISIT
jgi:catechol 2,3-dioxygenase-like lactoylglutathione lyase family enzyme